MRPSRIRVSLAAVVAAGCALAAAALPGPQPPDQRPAPGQGQGAGPAAQAAPARIRRLPRPADYLQWAAADAADFGPWDTFFLRWIALPEDPARPGHPDMAEARSLAVALMYASRGLAISRPEPVFAGGANGRLVRIDLRSHAPRDQDLAEWLTLWEELQFDPAFALLITRDNLRFAGVSREDLARFRRIKKVAKVVPAQPARIETRKVVHPGGRFVYPPGAKRHGQVLEDVAPGEYEIDFLVPAVAATTVLEEVLEEVDAVLAEGVLRLVPGHLDAAVFARLVDLTASAAPVVTSRYLKSRILATIKNDKADTKVFRTIWGGLYYEFRGIKKARDVLGQDTKATDLDLFLENLGIGNIQAGLTAEKLFDKLASDQAVAMLRSEVTGKPREVLAFSTPAVSRYSSWGSITGDVFDADVDVGFRAFMNLLTPRRRAREAIFPTVTGFPIFALFDGAGALQDEVPPDVAVDTTIPAPYTRRLQCAISCIRCHGTDGSDGWKPASNDVLKLTRGKLDILDDLGGLKLDISAVDRLAGKYGGELTRSLQRGRDDLAEVTLLAGGPWPGGGDQADAHRRFAVRLADEWAGYWYTRVDARIALAELGFAAPADRAVDVLRELLPPDPGGRFEGFTFEDPRLGALVNGLAIERSDWDLVRSVALERIKRSPAFARWEAEATKP